MDPIPVSFPAIDPGLFWHQSGATNLAVDLKYDDLHLYKRPGHAPIVDL